MKWSGPVVCLVRSSSDTETDVRQSVVCASEMELGHKMWPSDPGIQQPGDPVDPVTLFCNELQMSTYVWRSILRPKNFLIIIGKSKSSLHGLTSSDFSPTTDTWQWLLSFQHFKCTFCILGIFFENRKNSGLTRGQNDDLVTQTWKMTQMTHWPGDPMTQFHVWCVYVWWHSWMWFMVRSMLVIHVVFSAPTALRAVSAASAGMVSSGWKTDRWLSLVRCEWSRCVCIL